MKKLIIIGCLLLSIGTYAQSNLYTRQVLGNSNEYRFSSEISWGDEFNYSGSPDASKWGFDVGNGYGGWGNNELQFATDRIDNSEVSSGKLNIIAKQESYNGFNYTSARLSTKTTKMFQYGRFVIRAKLPNSNGVWPAAFMFGENHQLYNLSSWPACGEIDIFELAGSRPTTVTQSLHTETYHYGQDFQSNDATVTDASTAFHDYRIDWTPDYIRYFIDDVQTLEFLNDGSGHDGFPFNDHFNLLIALNVGGDFLGTGNPATVDNSSLPKTLEIEHVRYYELLGNYETAPITRITGPTVTPTSLTINANQETIFNAVDVPAGKTVNWYAFGGLVATGNMLYLPANFGLIGTFEATAILVDNTTGEFSEPTHGSLTINP